MMNWNLETGHQLSVDNEGAQTVVKIVHQTAGQQQRSTNSFTTGIWLAPPQLIVTPTGAILKIVATNGESLIQIQGNNIQMQNSHHSIDRATTNSQSSFEPMQSMQPMQPMQMGNMQMSMQPMTMRMGDMELNMGEPSSEKPRFCTECGTSVRPTDKFCASCGNKLT